MASEARVYVGNLSWEVTSRDLKEHMGRAGEVESAEVMTEAASGRSKGCGLVVYSTEASAKKACDELTDTELLGRQIFVREDRGKGTKGGKGDKGGKGVQSSRLYVGNLSRDATNKDLEDLFGTCGEVVSANVTTDFEGASKGFAIVEFKTTEQAQEAMDKLQDSEILGRTIFVREDRGKKGKGDEKGGKGYDDGKGYGGRKGKGYDDGKGYGGKGRSKGKSSFDGDGGKGGDPMCKVFVSNLAFSVSWQDLKDHCRTVGNVVHVEIMTEGGVKGGRSKGYGVVEFGTLGEAKEAVQQLHDSDLSGRLIAVREFRP